MLVYIRDQAAVVAKRTEKIAPRSKEGARHLFGKIQESQFLHTGKLQEEHLASEIILYIIMYAKSEK